MDLTYIFYHHICLLKPSEVNFKRHDSLERIYKNDVRCELITEGDNWNVSLLFRSRDWSTRPALTSAGKFNVYLPIMLRRLEVKLGAVCLF